MVNFAVVSSITGLVLNTGRTDLESLSATAGDNDVISPIPADVRDETHRYDWSLQQFIAIPPRPGPWAEWDGTSWLDPRTDASMAAERQAALYAARGAAQKTKSELLMILAQMGIMTEEDAIQAAQGQIPASFETAIASMPVDLQGMARIKWAGDTLISRMNPLIVLAAYHLSLSDEQLDAAFGVVIPA